MLHNFKKSYSFSLNLAFSALCFPSRVRYQTNIYQPSSIKLVFLSFSKIVQKIMPAQILAESVISLERTLVYQTVFKNFVLLIQQKRQGDVWQTYQHCFLARLFINAIASLTEKTKPAECSLITSGGDLPPKTLPTFQHLGMESLPEDVKRILFWYDCDCVHLFENHHLSSLRKLS